MHEFNSGDHTDISESSRAQAERLSGELQEIVDNQDPRTQWAADIATHVTIEPENIAKEFGVPLDIAEGAINDAEIMKDEVRIATRRSLRAFRRILEDGKLKNFEEAGTSGADRGTIQKGAGYAYTRIQYETRRGSRREGQPPPLYGFLEDLSTLGERQQAASYGQVELILKPEVMQRSVYTDGNSLGQGLPLYDLNTGLVAKRVRDRLRQRPGKNRGGHPYTEATILGGVSIEDIEGVVIDLDHQQQKVEADAINNLISEVFQKLPDAQLTFRIRGGARFPGPVILKLAQEHPEIIFAVTITAASAAGFESPFRSLGPLSAEDIAQPKTREAFTDRAKTNHAHATDRRAELQQKSQQYWESLGTDQPLPANVTFHLLQEIY